MLKKIVRRSPGSGILKNYVIGVQQHIYGNPMPLFIAYDSSKGFKVAFV